MYKLPDGGQAASPLEFLWRLAGWLKEGATAEAGEEMEKALRDLDRIHLRVFEKNLEVLWASAGQGGQDESKIVGGNT